MLKQIELIFMDMHKIESFQETMIRDIDDFIIFNDC